MTHANPVWSDLFELLGPIHDDVQLFARRIARSNAEGDDVFQEAVLRAACKLGSLRDRSRFKSWMFSVVASVHRTRYRRSFWRRWVSSEEATPPDPIGDDGSRWVVERASASRATAALACLEAPQREAIVLFELHGYSIDEIAEIQNASVSAVKSRLVRGRQRLRVFYAGSANRDCIAPKPRRYAVADPWTDDFAALGEHSRSQLRSIAATRATVISAGPETTRMRMYKQHPVLTTLLALAVLALFSGAAYAVVDRVFVSVDPDASASDIQNDIKTQLDAAGFPTTVTAGKSADGDLKITIQTADERLGSKLEVAVPNESQRPVAQTEAFTIEIGPEIDVNDPRLAQLITVSSSPRFVVPPAGQTRDQLVAAIRVEFAARSLGDFDVIIKDHKVVVTVKAPPTP